MAKALFQDGSFLMVGGAGLFGKGRVLAGQIAEKTGCTFLVDTFFARGEKGAGTTRFTQLPYPVEPKIEQLREARHIVLCGVDRPVAFFAYPGKPSLPEPVECQISTLCDRAMDVNWTLGALAEVLELRADSPAQVMPLDLPAPATGALTLEKIGTSIAAYLPENAIVINESVTSGFAVIPPLATARKHDLLTGTGGAIGLCLPCATGAAVACPDRKVLALTGDGSAMYTLQSLWTMARENLDVTVVVFANRGYQILRDEMVNVGVPSYGRNAERMFDMKDPEIDWVALAKGHGVAATRAENMGDFNAALTASFASQGPHLIEVVCP